jgi:hypothetical protein
MEVRNVYNDYFYDMLFILNLLQQKEEHVCEEKVVNHSVLRKEVGKCVKSDGKTYS